ncbi:MAG: ribonuclease D [Longimicrobiales bacterium]
MAGGIGSLRDPGIEPKRRFCMDYDLIDTPEALPRAAALLAETSRISLDCEAAGFHRYSDRLCLVQLSTPRANLILDPLSLDLTTLLRPLLEDPEVQVVMHGADYDIRLLDRDLGIRLRGLFDTQAAASLLGAKALGLAALLEEHLGVKLPKTHQRADWAQRPLPRGMLEYAAADTRHLPSLADLLAQGLREKGREEWAREEFEVLEGIRWEEEQTDPVTRVKGARELVPRALGGLREALAWRDEIAKSKDRAPFRVVGDQALLEIVVTRPPSVEELARLKGVSPHLARQHGRDLLDRLERVDGLPAEALVRYPRLRGDGAGRPTPEEEALANRIRDLRTEKARELGLDRGILLSNAQIAELVRRGPRTVDELAAIPGIRKWQAEVLGTEVLRVVKRG